MAVGLPAKTTYANGDVFSASDINDTNGTINLIGQTTNFYAGKNRIINGDFFVNQRSFTSSTTDAAYGFDRWQMFASGGATYSAQTFTPGSAPVAGYEGQNFARIVTTGQSGASVYTILNQSVENVRTLADKTVTLSFYAKAASGTPKVAVSLDQVFGSGGSPSSAVKNYGGQITLNTNWVRYSTTITMPNLSGKTIGTTPNTSSTQIRLWVSAGSDSNAETGSLGIQSNTFDFWGVQLEAGSTATAFQTATGTIQGELAACQRYGYALNQLSGTSAGGNGWNFSTTQSVIYLPLPVQMRTTPTVTYTTPGGVIVYNSTGGQLACTAMSGTTHSLTSLYIVTTVASGLVVGNGTSILVSAGSSQILFASAEL
jgi:hypothetical protein